MASRDELLRRAREYLQRYGLALGDELGAGVHGIVFATESQPEKGISAVRSAIKVHHREPHYLRERDVYLRLKARAVTTIRGCHVPQFLHHDDELWVIDMTVVKRPFVLDFAGATIDKPPDYSEEVLAEWAEEKQEQFGPRWPDVQAILRSLQGHGIYLMDVNPGNIAFAD